MVILTIALVALAEMMAITLRMQMLGRNETEAVRLAQTKLDELIGLVSLWDDTPAIAIGGGLDDDVEDYSDVPPDAPGFTRRWVVTAGPVDPGGDAGDLRIVTVRVVPASPDRRTSTPVQLTTMLRRQ